MRRRRPGRWGRRSWLLGAGMAVLLLSACDSGTSAPSGAGASSVPPGASLTSVRAVLAATHTTDGKPLTLYLGAQYCPFCASMRWPLVKALSRFGTFTGLGQEHSQAGVDGFPSLATYDLTHATYTSQFVTLRIVETADVNGQPLQQPDSEESSLVNQFDPQGSIPFVFVGGRYVATLPYSPSLLQGLTFDQILTDINGATPDLLGTSINHEADVITALICSTDNSQPSAVCSAPAITAVAASIPR